MNTNDADLSNVYNLGTGDLPVGMPDRLLTKAELAALCRVRTRTVENWMKLGMPYYKIHRVVRFKLGDVISHLDANHRRSESTTSIRNRTRLRGAG
jgi:hypothetical protein